MLHLDQRANGRYIKLDQFIKLDDITKVDHEDGKLKITHKDKIIEFTGQFVDEVAKVLQEVIKGVAHAWSF